MIKIHPGKLLEIIKFFLDTDVDRFLIIYLSNQYLIQDASGKDPH